MRQSVFVRLVQSALDLLIFISDSSDSGCMHGNNFALQYRKEVNRSLKYFILFDHKCFYPTDCEIKVEVAPHRLTSANKLALIISIS